MSLKNGKRKKNTQSYTGYAVIDKDSEKMLYLTDTAQQLVDILTSKSKKPKRPFEIWTCELTPIPLNLKKSKKHGRRLSFAIKK